MKGFVPTPTATVDHMVERLFCGRLPSSDSNVLDPGCGPGAFISGILRWCKRRRCASLPRIVGVESDSCRIQEAALTFGGDPAVEIRNVDFLAEPGGESFDFIIGNPPYVSIIGLSDAEKHLYRAKYFTAQGRFDLYLLFFEQALRLLKPDGRLVFITPEKYLYVDSAKPLRQLLNQFDVEEIELVDEATFGSLVTYPTITTVVKRQYSGQTRVVRRDGSAKCVKLARDGKSWLPLISQDRASEAGANLDALCLRISAGVATGADEVFVLKAEGVGKILEPFAYPTIAGRGMGADNPKLITRYSMLLPYSADGRLLPESRLGSLGDYLRQPKITRRLLERTCVNRKPWYAFHETPPLPAILRPKILCKDITAAPQFWVDRTGEIVPRHSVYYIVPKRPGVADGLCDYLNSESATKWLRKHCQRAASGFLRLQSGVLKRLPIPRDLAGEFGDSEEENPGLVDGRSYARRLASPIMRAFEFAR